MIKNYFEKMMNQLLEEKSRLEKKQILIDNRINEIDRFVEILDEKNDTSFESFTPREVNSKNKEKIRELDQERRNLQKVQVDIKHKLVENEKSREELTIMMQEIENQEAQIKKETEAEEEAVSRENVEELGSAMDDIESIMKRIHASMQYIDVDMVRSKLELRQLIPRLDESLKRIREMI